jgi:hypothetical protein
MNTESTWQATLGQLQLEIPRTAFNSWGQDTHFFLGGMKMFSQLAWANLPASSAHASQQAKLKCKNLP